MEHIYQLRTIYQYNFPVNLVSFFIEFYSNKNHKTADKPFLNY